MLQWSDVYIAAELYGECFRDMHIVTLKSDIISNLQQQAVCQLNTVDQQIIQQYVIDNIDNQQYVHESVTIDDTVTVVVDRDVIDQTTTEYALSLVADALDKLDGKRGTIQYPTNKQVHQLQISNLYYH